MIEITTDLVTVVADQLPQINEEQVAQVLTALNNVYDGPPVGTILHNPSTGEVAHRVSQNGVLIWRITDPQGGFSGDHRPTLDGFTVTLVMPETPTP